MEGKLLGEKLKSVELVSGGGREGGRGRANTIAAPEQNGSFYHIWNQWEKQWQCLVAW